MLASLREVQWVTRMDLQSGHQLDWLSVTPLVSRLGQSGHQWDSPSVEQSVTLVLMWGCSTDCLLGQTLAILSVTPLVSRLDPQSGHQLDWLSVDQLVTRLAMLRELLLVLMWGCWTDCLLGQTLAILSVTPLASRLDPQSGEQLDWLLAYPLGLMMETLWGSQSAVS
jgi:hypothetical protein